MTAPLKQPGALQRPRSQVVTDFSMFLAHVDNIHKQLLLHNSPYTSSRFAAILWTCRCDMTDDVLGGEVMTRSCASTRWKQIHGSLLGWPRACPFGPYCPRSMQRTQMPPGAWLLTLPMGCAGKGSDGVLCMPSFSGGLQGEPGRHRIPCASFARRKSGHRVTQMVSA